MNEIKLKNRVLYRYLPEISQKGIFLLAGARETGKTTLVKTQYPTLKYVNLQTPEDREGIHKMGSTSWAKEIGNAVIDEAQRDLSVFEKIKYAYEQNPMIFQLVLGSSQIWLLKKIKDFFPETFSLYEMWPLFMIEILNSETNFSLTQGTNPLLEELFSSRDFNDIFKNSPSVLTPEQDQRIQNLEQYLLRWGGMPALLTLSDEDRRKWLKDYEYTYLERDLVNLVRLEDHEIFHKFKRLASLQSGHLLNYSELARDATISVDTARRYTDYLKLSYQVMFLLPYTKKITSSVVKTPKVYWFDVGLLRHLSGYRGEYGGFIYHTMVIGEILKWMRTTQKREEVFFYRTRSGLEIDLILETRPGTIAMVTKSRDDIVLSDAKPLKDFAKHLGKKWRGGLIIYQGPAIKKIAEPNIWAVPSRRLFT